MRDYGGKVADQEDLKAAAEAALRLSGELDRRIEYLHYGPEEDHLIYSNRHPALAHPRLKVEAIAAMRLSFEKYGQEFLFKAHGCAQRGYYAATSPSEALADEAFSLVLDRAGFPGIGARFSRPGRESRVMLSFSQAAEVALVVEQLDFQLELEHVVRRKPWIFKREI